MAVVESSLLGSRGPSCACPPASCPSAAVAVDVLLLPAATVTAMLGRQQLPFFDASDDVSAIVLVAAGPLLAGWLVMVRGVGGYSREVFGAGTEEYKRIIRASMLCAGLVGIGCYLTSFPLSRGFFLLAFAIGTPLIVLGRVALRRAIQRARVGGHLRGDGSSSPGTRLTSTRWRPYCAASRGWGTPFWVRSPRPVCRDGRPPPASRSSATPTPRQPSSRSWPPRSSCSPKAPSGPARSSGGRPGSWKDCRSSRSSSRA